MTNEEKNLPATNSDVNAEDSDGKTPLMKATASGDSEIGKTLFDGKTDVDTEGMKIAASATANPASDFEYTKSDGEVTIIKLKDKEMKGKLVIPSTIDGLPVTSIGNEASDGFRGLTSLTIPESVTSIGEGVFDKCDNLTIRTPRGSVAEKYAKNHKISCINNESLSTAKLANVANRKKWFTIGLFVLIPVMLLFFIVFGVHTSEYEYTISAGKVTITGLKDEKMKGEVVIPSTIDGLPVTSIGDKAFLGCSGLTSLTLPASATSIGGGAFAGCSGLTSVAIPESVTSIGGGAFAGCSGLTSVAIPESVTSIGGEAFWGCSDLTSVMIPKSVTNIGEGAFLWCKNLTSIEVASGNTYYQGIDGVLLTKDGKAILSYPAGKYGSSYRIPESVSSIGAWAFASCGKLTSVTIPEGVTRIGDFAFKTCSGLRSVTIPGSVTSIGKNAFSDCSGLTSIEVASGNTHYQVIDRSLFTKDGKTILRYPAGKKGSYRIPGSVTSIGDYAFKYCSGLTAVTIPKGVTSIGDWAFAYCFGLTSVTIPESVTSIGKMAFSGCSDLKSLTLPASVTSVGESAFENCRDLTSVTIPGSVTSIGKNAFSGCNSLTSIELASGNAYYQGIDGVLLTKDGKTILSYPAGKCGSYHIPASVTSIGDRVFSGCSGLTSVTIPESVTSIGKMAFSGCNSLTSIELASGNAYYQGIDGVLLTKDGKTILSYPAGIFVHKSYHFYKLLTDTYRQISHVHDIMTIGTWLLL